MLVHSLQALSTLCSINILTVCGRPAASWGTQKGLLLPRLGAACRAVQPFGSGRTAAAEWRLHLPSGAEGEGWSVVGLNSPPSRSVHYGKPEGSCHMGPPGPHRAPTGPPPGPRHPRALVLIGSPAPAPIVVLSAAPCTLG